MPVGSLDLDRSNDILGTSANSGAAAIGYTAQAPGPWVALHGRGSKSLPVNFTWDVLCLAAPAALVINLEGTVDPVNGSILQLDTYTGTTSTVKLAVAKGPVLYVRANPTTFTTPSTGIVVRLVAS